VAHRSRHLQALFHKHLESPSYPLISSLRASFVVFKTHTLHKGIPTLWIDYVSENRILGQNLIVCIYKISSFYFLLQTRTGFFAVWFELQQALQSVRWSRLCSQSGGAGFAVSQAEQALQSVRWSRLCSQSGGAGFAVSQTVCVADVNWRAGMCEVLTYTRAEFCFMRGFRLPQRCRWDLHCSVVLRSVDC
jgi:hypothetical protein